MDYKQIKNAPSKTLTLVLASTAILTVGSKPQARVVSNFSGKIKRWTVLSDVNATAIIDVLKSTDGSTPIASIAASAKPSISNQITNESEILTGWDVDVEKGDIFQMEIESNNAAKYLAVQIIIE